MSSPELSLDGEVALYGGDMLAILPALEADTLDACVTDPPYHLQSIHARFAERGRDETSERYSAGPYGRHATGFMGKQWDGGGVAFDPATWRAVYRVLKPGAHLVAFGGTRTYHRLAVAIEDAGFEIRDTIMWLYGSGFPKSHDVSKGIDRAAGVKGTLGGPRSAAHAAMLARGTARRGTKHAGWDRPWMDDPEAIAAAQLNYIPATDAAREWAGWGTALKPAVEPIVLARKPLAEPTVAANVLKWRTGALNIDGCRVDPGEIVPGGGKSKRGANGGGIYGDGEALQNAAAHNLGRWPANVAHDGSDEVVAGFPDEAGGGFGRNGDGSNTVRRQMRFGMKATGETVGFGDAGSAARFFYTAKADADDRLGSKHPTVKPLELVQWLVRLVTPRGGCVLDPFAGTGSTGEAAWREGAAAILIEREAEYCADVRRRLALALAGPDERARERIKAAGRTEPAETLPLFGGAPEREIERETWAEMWARPFDWSTYYGEGPP